MKGEKLPSVFFLVTGHPQRITYRIIDRSITVMTAKSLQRSTSEENPVLCLNTASYLHYSPHTDYGVNLDRTCKLRYKKRGEVKKATQSSDTDKLKTATCHLLIIDWV